MICDFDCKIFNVNRFDLTVDNLTASHWSERFLNDLEILDRCSIHRIACTVRHNEDQSTKNTLVRVNDFNKFIKQSIGVEAFNKFKIQVYPRLFLSEDSPYIKNISKLTIGNTNRIFLELPLFHDPAYLDESINKILYNCRLVPIFTDFQNYNLIYPTETIDKLIRIRDASFIFSIFKANQSQNIDLIKRIIKNGNKTIYKRYRE